MAQRYGAKARRKGTAQRHGAKARRKGTGLLARLAAG
jgi:hypothetical protein